MAKVLGHVFFDKQRAASVQGLHGIDGVAVVLQSVNAPYLWLGALTNGSGRYEFTNVPSGEYRLVEVFGAAAVSSPANFNDAVAGEIHKAVVPPIGSAPEPPAGATHLDCVTPNTLFISVDNEDKDDLNFLNGPVKYVSIDTRMDNCAVICPDNLLVDADFGTMGTFSAGTAENTGEPTEPFPENVPEFEYVLPLSHPVETPEYPPWYHAPEDGEYTVQNIMNDDNSNRIGAWWRIADHTTGNETGKMMVVNGYTQGSVFFREDVDVKPNTHYLFSAWIINLFRSGGWAAPKLGVIILDESGKEIYRATLGALIPVNPLVPEWLQIGTVISSHDNTKLTVKFLSEGEAAIGNDYAIDDISLNEIAVPMFTPVKSIDKSEAFVGETVVYTVVLTNTCTFPLKDIMFMDKLPAGLSFVVGSVTVNGAKKPSDDPEVGFALPDIRGGESVEVCFSALVESAEHTPAINKAEIHYEYTPVEGGAPTTYDVESNEVPLDIVQGDVSVTLLMSKMAIGAALVHDEFTFGIFEKDASDPLYTAKNDEKGLISFPAMLFSNIGEYNYTVKEIDAPADWEADTKEWPLTITVTNVQGKLIAMVKYPNGVPAFVNKHRSANCGAFQFPDLTYDKAGVYEYTLKELTPSGDGWTTDDSVIKIIVTVVDDGHGNLVATIEYIDGFPSFTNTYNAEPTRIVISGCKVAIGAPLPVGRFEFGLFDSEGNLIAKTTNEAANGM